MAETTIEWASHSWNPTTGCDRLTRGCRNCYALRMAGRAKLMGNPRYQHDGDPKSSGPGFALTVHPDRLEEPAHWRKPRIVFVDSMSDLFHEEVPTTFIDRVWGAMASAPRHTFLVLTKRPERMRDYLLERSEPAGCVYLPEPLPNVWLGTSIENRHVVKRADALRATPAAVRFVSAEPLLGPLDALNLMQIDWLIVGGESGPGAEPMDPQWARDLRDRCLDSICPLCCGAVTVGAWVCPRCNATGRETSFFFKQWGAWGPFLPTRKRRLPGGEVSRQPYLPKHVRHFERNARGVGLAERTVFRTNKKHQGRVLDQRTWDERPPLAMDRVEQRVKLGQP